VNHYKLLDVLMDKSLSHCQMFYWYIIGLAYKMFCVRWGSAYSSWFQISAGVRQGDIITSIVCIIYGFINFTVETSWVGLYSGECYGCLLYVDDILLMAHSMHAMQTMLEICDKVADEFDIKFNSNKSVAMHAGRRFDARCAAL